MLHREHNCRSGFTLIEVMVVLMIFSILGLWVVNIPNPENTLSLRSYLNQLKRDLYTAQQMAISQRASVRIYFIDGTGSYELRKTSMEAPIFSRKGLPTVSMELVTMNSTITVNATGSFDKAGKIWFRTKEETYEMCFLIGQGRFYETKL